MDAPLICCRAHHGADRMLTMKATCSMVRRSVKSWNGKVRFWRVL